MNTLFGNCKRETRLTRHRLFLAVAALAISCTAGAQPIRTTVDSVLVDFPDVQPAMVNGRVMVPVRGVFEHMDASVTWNANTRTVTAQRGTDTIMLPVGATSATVNGQLVFLDAPANMRSGRVMVPLRFLSETLGASVEWLEASRTVAITNAAASPPRFNQATYSQSNGSQTATQVQQDHQMAEFVPMYGVTAKQFELYTAMRSLWEEHVSWTRMFILSNVGDSRNRDATTARLMQNQTDIGDAIKPAYGESAGNRLTSLLKEHISLASDVVTAAKQGDATRAADKKRDAHQNADQIADFLYNANPNNWNRTHLRDMMREHLDLTFAEAEAEINGDYFKSVRTYDEVQTQILAMADMLSEGIVRQFPETYPGGANGGNDTGEGLSSWRMAAGTVIPFVLVQRLTSSTASVGDRFTANLDTGGQSSYEGLPQGTVLEGSVDVVRAKSGDTPGVLGLKFDRVRTPDGQVYNIYGSLIGLDKNSVTNEDGRLVAKDGAKDNNLKYVGYGAGAGALVAILTDGNIITNSLIGGALGFLFGEIQKDPSKARNVVLDSGSKFGVRLTNDLSFRALGKR